MNRTKQHYHMVAKIAAKAVAKAQGRADANARLNRTIGPLMPLLRRAAAKEHAVQTKSFVNADRIDISVEVYLSGVDVVTAGNSAVKAVLSPVQGRVI